MTTFVGRTGGLAVAMGIGAALITFGCGSAQAEADGATASSTSSSSSAPASSSKSSAQSAKSKSTGARFAPQRLRAKTVSQSAASVRKTPAALASSTTVPTTPAEPPPLEGLLGLTRRNLATKSTAVAAPTVDATFTGEPSLVSQALVTGLRLLKPIVDLFGVDIAGSGASIPLFTDGVPPGILTHGLNVTNDEYDGWKVWTLTPAEPTGEVVIGIHGGSFTLQASFFHWWTYADTARDTGATVIVPLYPLANAEGTGGTAVTVIPTMADFIAGQVAAHGAENVSVLGDSAGGTIAMAAAQELVRRCDGDQECLADHLPSRMVLLSPALDLSDTNPYVGLIDDPLLALVSGSGAAFTWANGLQTPEDPDGTLNPLVSPLFGSLDNLPQTAVYAGSLDLTAASVLALQQKVADNPGSLFTFELRKGQIHDWVIFPLPDAIAERPGIYHDLGL